ncbi:MAG: hypothetical protein ACXWAV_08455 [Chthoniobacterales bacterium]
MQVIMIAKAALRFAASMLLCSGFNLYAQEVPHTPKPGSAERQAICDAARVFVLNKYATAPLPQPIVFKIEHLSVSGDYANMEAIPLFKDGRYVDPNLIPDIVFNFCLKSAGGGWRVIADLSRTDVPDASEIASIRQRLSGFPRELLSRDWQRLLAP